MKRLLVGRSVLTVEDEPFVTVDLMEELKSAGARAILAQTVGEALSEVGCPNFISSNIGSSADGRRLLASLREAKRKRRTVLQPYRI